MVKIRFWSVYLVIGIVQFVGWFLWGPGWLLKRLGKWNPFWFTQDDTRLDPTKPNGLANDYAVHLSRYKHIWWGVITWHLQRNVCWNFVNLFPVYNGSPEIGNQLITITKIIDDHLYSGLGVKLKQDGPWVVSAALKFIGKPGQDIWQINNGDVISSQTSITGRGEIEYKALKPNGKYWNSWRFTSCEVVTYNFLFFKKTYWRTIFLGTNGARYAFKFKHQAIKPWDDDEY